MKEMYVYITTNKTNAILYVGVTNNLVRRIYEHKHKMFDGYTAKYNLDKLVYYEVYNDEITAIERKKFLKKAYKNYKLSLIRKLNPLQCDLYDEIVKSI